MGDVVAWWSAVVADGEDLADLGKGEAGNLRLADERDTPHDASG